MLSIYCGDDTGTSRKAYSSKRKEYIAGGYQCITISSGTIDELTSALQGGQSLFEEKKAIFLENCFSKKQLRDVVKKNLNNELTILAWEDSMPERDLKKYFPTAQVFAFQLPSSIWQFLDGLYPGNAQALLTLHAALQDTVEEPLLFFLLRQRIKDLILVSHRLPGKTKRAPWQESKLVSQSRRWDSKVLMQFHKKLGDIEVGTKTDEIPYSVKNALDILFCFYVQ